MSEKIVKRKKCCVPDCTNMATLKYRECNKHRVERKNANNKNKNICTGCNKILKDNNFKTCEICRNRGKVNRSKCTICGENAYLNNYCNDHYNEYYDTRTLILLNNKDDLKVNNAHLHAEQYDKKYFIENAIDRLTNSYVAGLYDGDGSFIIHKIDSGYQLSVTLSQSVKNILILLQQKYGGYIYTGKRKNEQQRINYGYRLSGIHAIRILKDLKDHIILKYHQVLNCIEFYSLIDKVNKIKEKEEHYLKNRQLNKLELVLDKPLYRINDNYIAGIFDAEGCIGIMRRDNDVIRPTIYAQISQKNHPYALEIIKEYLGYGRIIDNLKWHTDKYADLDNFLKCIEGKLIVKQYQFTFFKEFLDSCKNFGTNLTTEQHNRRLFLHKEIHDDKHIDRISIDKKEDISIEIDDIPELDDEPKSSDIDLDEYNNYDTTEVNNSIIDQPKITFKFKTKIEPKLTFKSKKNIIPDINTKIDNLISISEKTILNNKLSRNKIKTEWNKTHIKTPINIGDKNNNFGKSFDYEHKLKISLANSARTVKLTMEQFIEIRELLKNSTIISIANKFKCDRNFMAKIKNGYKHPDEVRNLSPEEFKQYEESYLKPLILKKMNKNK